MRNISLSLFCCFLCGLLSAQDIIEGKPLPSWEDGYLEIHHINTGRGNAAYFIFPDGTTMLVDAGELSPLDKRTFTKRNAEIRPDSSRKPYEWIVNYIKQHAPHNNNLLDFALITHFHDDHFGAWYPEAPLSADGRFRLTGITGIAELLKVGTLIDRAAPDYNYPYSLKDSAEKNGGGEIAFGRTILNYFEFLKKAGAGGMKVASLRVGDSNQIRLLRSPVRYKNFYVRNIKSGQWISDGQGKRVDHFPGYDASNKSTWPDENSLSLAISVHYGNFSYYTGGDNPGMIFPGDNPARNTETAIAAAVGEVDVATMDHHGNRDAINEEMIRRLRPRVWIGQSWSADHPGHEVLLRLVNRHINSTPGDLFATNMLEANKLVIGPLIDDAYKSQQGHIVVRVMPGGEKYSIIVLDDLKSEAPVKKVFGPYTAKKSIK